LIVDFIAALVPDHSETDAILSREAASAGAPARVPWMEIQAITIMENDVW